MAVRRFTELISVVLTVIALTRAMARAEDGDKEDKAGSTSNAVCFASSTVTTAYSDDQVDSAPQLLTDIKPDYTDKAKLHRVEGCVRERVLVDVDGVVKRIRLISVLPDGLNEEAMDIAYKALFFPALKDNRQVPCWVTLDVEFKLE